ncbi:centrosomal protein of 19 kDa [Parasteatoda tepidariorum]|nr:centrosomal protein of 19 kDa [Parasteatoda tepidariorum]XP_042905476.1 centrosomal protein of 19 kDa [Parasteatoda tepidariorum]
MAEVTASNKIKPLKIGVRFKQPAIVLLYQSGATFRKRIMPIRGLKKNSSVALIASDLKDHHEKYLQNVPDFKVEKMLRLIQNDMKGLDLEESLQELAKEFTIDPDQNLNDVDDFTLRKKKELMDVSFEKNRKKPGDPDFQYDIEVDFSAEAGIESSIWDSEKEDIEF